MTAPSATNETDVRVRFCPSPTGTPHVGLIRTALFNWAHARHNGGAFVLRIEDTDAARDSAESYAALLDALRWLGLDWDEGPEVGGPHGPYRQSERGEVYADALRRLVEAGEVYESFSSAAEIEARHRAAGRDPKLGYDNADRDLTEQQKAAFRTDGRRPVFRLRMPDRDISFTDLIRGEITFRAGAVPDFALARGDGTPLYPLTNPLDDALMGITHVLRGEDLLPSTRARSRSSRRSRGSASAPVRRPTRTCRWSPARAAASSPSATRSRTCSSTATADSSRKDCSTISHFSAGRSATTGTCSPSTRWSRHSTCHGCRATRRGSTSGRPRRSIPRTCECSRPTTSRAGSNRMSSPISPDGRR